MKFLLFLIVAFIAQGIYRNWSVYTGKSKTFDALAPHLNEKGEIEGSFPDDSQFEGAWWGNFWRWWKKISKPWFAFGPRSNYWFARTRNFPVVLFAIGDKNSWRYENDKQDLYGFTSKPPKGWYLSRVQYNKRWHVQIQWPLFFEVQISNWELYVGMKKDPDNFWLSFYPGRTWK